MKSLPFDGIQALSASKILLFFDPPPGQLRAYRNGKAMLFQINSAL
jgi:hypothetical protein